MPAAPLRQRAKRRTSPRPALILHLRTSRAGSEFTPARPVSAAARTRARLPRAAPGVRTRVCSVRSAGSARFPAPPEKGGFGRCGRGPGLQTARVTATRMRCEPHLAKHVPKHNACQLGAAGWARGAGTRGGRSGSQRSGTAVRGRGWPGGGGRLGPREAGRPPCPRSPAGGSTARVPLGALASRREDPRAVGGLARPLPSRGRAGPGTRLYLLPVGAGNNGCF